MAVEVGQSRDNLAYLKCAVRMISTDIAQRSNWGRVQLNECVPPAMLRRSLQIASPKVSYSLIPFRILFDFACRFFLCYFFPFAVTFFWHFIKKYAKHVVAVFFLFCLVLFLILFCVVLCVLSVVGSEKSIRLITHIASHSK